MFHPAVARQNLCGHKVNNLRSCAQPGVWSELEACLVSCGLVPSRVNTGHHTNILSLRDAPTPVHRYRVCIVAQDSCQSEDAADPDAHDRRPAVCAGTDSPRPERGGILAATTRRPEGRQNSREWPRTPRRDSGSWSAILHAGASKSLAVISRHFNTGSVSAHHSGAATSRTLTTRPTTRCSRNSMEASGSRERWQTPSISPTR